MQYGDRVIHYVWLKTVRKFEHLYEKVSIVASLHTLCVACSVLNVFCIIFTTFIYVNYLNIYKRIWFKIDEFQENI